MNFCFVLFLNCTADCKRFRLLAFFFYNLGQNKVLFICDSDFLRQNFSFCVAIFKSIKISNNKIQRKTFPPPCQNTIYIYIYIDIDHNKTTGYKKFKKKKICIQWPEVSSLHYFSFQMGPWATWRSGQSWRKRKRTKEKENISF